MPEQEPITESLAQGEISEGLLLTFVKEAFSASGLTQKEVAAALGITQASVSKAIGGDPNQRSTMIRILNTWHPTFQVEPLPILRYRISRRST